jgi:hypothetical protein
MPSTLSKIRQLKLLKSLRRDIAEREKLAAMRELAAADAAVAGATAMLDMVRQGARSRRLERLEAIFASRTDHAAVGTLAVDTYLQTDRELNAARSALEASHHARNLAGKRADLAHARLARKLLEESKADRILDELHLKMRQGVSRQN